MVLGIYAFVHMIRIVADIERSGAGVELHDLLLPRLLLWYLFGANFDASEFFELRHVLQQHVHEVAHCEGDFDLLTPVTLPVEFRRALSSGIASQERPPALALAHTMLQSADRLPRRRLLLNFQKLTTRNRPNSHCKPP